MQTKTGPVTETVDAGLKAIQIVPGITLMVFSLFALLWLLNKSYKSDAPSKKGDAGEFSRVITYWGMGLCTILFALGLGVFFGWVKVG